MANKVFNILTQQVLNCIGVFNQQTFNYLSKQKCYRFSDPYNQTNLARHSQSQIIYMNSIDFNCINYSVIHNFIMKTWCTVTDK